MTILKHTSYVIIFGIFLLGACKGDQETKVTPEAIFQELTAHTDDNLFRGVKMGMKQDRVLAIETDRANDSKRKPLEQRKSEEELHFKFGIPELDSAYYEINYQFDYLGLFEIHFDIHLKDEEDVADLFDYIQSVFDKKYGDNTDDGMFTTWYYETKRNAMVEISMVDDSKYHGSPMLSLFFHEQTIGDY